MHPTLVGTPALTLLNPWAHLIAHHGKDVENRTWMPPERVSNLLIHAGKGWQTPAQLPDGVRISDVVTSAIVAVADLAFACQASRYRETVVCQCGPWAMAGYCHWHLINVRPLPEPVPATGRQGLWRPTPDVLAAVDAQLFTRR